MSSESLKRGRPLGSGTLSADGHVELYRALQMRNALTNRALAARFKVTLGCIKSAAHRIRRKGRVELVLSDPTDVPPETSES